MNAASVSGKPRGIPKESAVKVTVPTENSEQAALFRMAGLHTAKYPELALMIAIPNGGNRGKAEAGIFRATGVKAGVSDIFLPVARGGRHGFWLELKRTRGGRVSEAQAQWLEAMRGQGYEAAVAEGWEAAWFALMGYLERRP